MSHNWWLHLRQEETWARANLISNFILVWSGIRFLMRVARSTQSVSCNISRLNKIHLNKNFYIHTYTFLVLFKAQKYTCKRLFFSFLGIAFIPVKLLFILCISEVRCGYKNVPRHPEMAEIQPPDWPKKQLRKKDHYLPIFSSNKVWNIPPTASLSSLNQEWVF